MSQVKREMEEAEEAWDFKAKAEGYRCAICHQHIPYDEREVYFATGLCGYHAHIEEKDD